MASTAIPYIHYDGGEQQNQPARPVRNRSRSLRAGTPCVLAKCRRAAILLCSAPSATPQGLRHLNKQRRTSSSTMLTQRVPRWGEKRNCLPSYFGGRMMARNFFLASSALTESRKGERAKHVKENPVSDDDASCFIWRKFLLRVNGRGAQVLYFPA